METLPIKNALRSGDFISGVVLTALGIFIIVESSGWGYSSPDGPGPAFFPFWYGVGMIVLSLALIGSTLLRPTFNAGKPIDWPMTGRALGTWAAFALSIALMAPLGFIISFTLFTFLFVLIIFRQPVVTAALTAVFCTLGFEIIFPWALGLQLPVGIFGF